MSSFGISQSLLLKYFKQKLIFVQSYEIFDEQKQMFSDYFIRFVYCAI